MGKLVGTTGDKPCLYSLFIRAGKSKWERVSTRCYPRDAALDMFKYALVGFAFQAIKVSIRPVTGPSVLPLAKCKARVTRIREIDAANVRQRITNSPGGVA